MSKYMQLTVRIRPYYKKGFQGAYPNIARRLAHLHESWTEEAPSLFEIAGDFDKFLYRLDGDPPMKALLLQHKSSLHKLYEEAEEQIADWHLAQADQLLYKIEDIFDEIEREVERL